LGRWINRDPLGEAGGLNLYGFVGNNPNYFIDTDGRAAWGWVARGGWAIGVWAGKSYLFDKYVQPHIDDVVIAVDNWNPYAGAVIGTANDAHQLLSLKKQVKNLSKLGCSIASGKGSKKPNLRTGQGYDAGDTPVRIEGEWTPGDMKQALLGHPPRGLGKPDLHHGGQMPGGAKHEVLPNLHRNNPALHPNKRNQGVTPEMRQSDRQLHWWDRAREQGADQVLPDWIYDD